MSITPNDILEKEFKRVFRGYDVEAVDSYMEDVAEVLAGVIKERNALRERVHDLESEIKGLRQQDEEIKGLLMAAKKVTEELKAQAEREAKILIEDAKLRAERIMEEARHDERRLRESLERLRRKRAQWVGSLKAMLESYLEALSREETTGGPKIREADEEHRDKDSPKNNLQDQKGHDEPKSQAEGIQIDLLEENDFDL